MRTTGGHLTMLGLPRRILRRAAAAVTGTALAVGGLTAIAAPMAHAANGVPRFDHVIIVMEENHSYNEIIGDTTNAPYINNTLAAGGASFTNSFAIEHPSEPNYLDLFSGSNQGVTSDACPQTFSAANEGAQLLAAGDTFAGYSEGLPSTGSTVCTSGAYARKHVPWTNFTNVPASDSLPWTSFPSSSNYASLPTVSWVIPNLQDDMHDGTIAQGDTWLQNNMNSYATWAKAHNSLLVVTWDEDDSSQSNQVPTIFYGANVQAGQYSNTINHYSVLRTVEDMYGLPYAGAAANATSITNVWSTAANTVSVTNPGNQTGTVGTAANLQIAATDSASGQTLTYSATGLPSGLSINSSTGLISGTPTAAGTSNVTVSAKDTTGASGATSFTWTVNPKPDFTLSVSPTSGTVTAGSSASATVSTAAVGGFSGTVSYSASGLPSGASASFSPTSGAAGSSSTLTLSTSSSTPAGTYAVTVTGTSGSLTHSATYSLTVKPVAANTVTVTNPGNQTNTVGTAASLQIAATDSASGQTLTYSATGLPAGLSINSSSGLISGTPTTPGTSNVTVTATDTTGAAGTASFSWTVNAAADFSLSVSPTSGTVTAGSAASASVATSAIGGFSGTVSFSASGLPSGASATFNPTSAAAGSGSTVTIGTSSSTPAGTYPITITGASGSLSHSTTFTLTVNPVQQNTVTVTNPGNQTGTAGSAARLQISATDSASGQTLAYSASGLPAGLSINSSTGLISGTPTAVGTSKVTVTATDTTGAAGTASFTWTIGASGGGCTAAQLLGNPGFENGTTSAPWTASSGVINNDLASEPSHSGSWDAWLDGYGTTHTDTLAQSVAIPTGCTSANFSFWLHIDTAETGTTAYDTLKVQVLNSSGTVLGTLSTFSNVDANTGYAQHSFSLAPYIGQTVTLKFTGSEDFELQTSFVIDDTALNVA